MEITKRRERGGVTGRKKERESQRVQRRLVSAQRKYNGQALRTCRTLRIDSFVTADAVSGREGGREKERAIERERDREVSIM